MGNKVKWIFFDCMETLVDLTDLPTLRDYAAWAYYGSGVEGLFNGFDAFYELYVKVKTDIASELENDREYEMMQRLERIIQLAAGYDYNGMKQSRQALYDNYWVNYKARCYVKDDIREMLPLLQKNFRLGVVSNFMVDGGIEELLEVNGISQYFDFVVTSIREGWKKPHIKIYDAAFRLSGATAGEILFAGDDYVNDYIVPAKLGMATILLDRYGRFEKVDNRAGDFYELEKLVNVFNKQGKLI